MKNDMPEIKRDIKRLLRKILTFFLQGLLYVGPVFVILFLVYKFFILIDGLLPFNVPGLGFLVIFAFITLAGYLGNTIIVRPIYKYLKKLLARVPLLKTIYDSITELLSAFVGNKKKFNAPVMVKMNIESEVYKLGFLTQDDLSTLKVRKGLVAVYLPHSYNFSGNMFIVPIENVTPLDLPSSDVMKFIVSGGVVDINLLGKSEKEPDEDPRTEQQAK
ncbi:MAG: DUF502 domain-containing protein [Bacteroidales bacterium]|nr:DUF502 domain-containing protein [Bacteroidales bacterium]